MLADQVGLLLPGGRVDRQQHVQVDLLLQVHGWTGFLDEYTHVGERGPRMDGLPVSVAALLVAEACNVGLTPVTDLTCTGIVWPVPAAVQVRPRHGVRGAISGREPPFSERGTWPGQHRPTPAPGMTHRQ